MTKHQVTFSDNNDDDEQKKMSLHDMFCEWTAVC